MLREQLEAMKALVASSTEGATAAQETLSAAAEREAARAASLAEALEENQRLVTAQLETLKVRGAVCTYRRCYLDLVAALFLSCMW